MHKSNEITVMVNTISFLHSHRSEILEQLKQDRWRVKTLPIKYLDVNGKVGVDRFFALVSHFFNCIFVILTCRSSVIHVISPQAIILFLTIRCFFKNKNVLLSFSGFGFLKPLFRSNLRGLLIFLFRILFFRFLGMVIVQNEEDRTICLKFGLRADQVYLIPGSGFNYSVARNKGCLNLTLPNAVRFLFASRLLKTKGVLKFVRAAHKLMEAGCHYEFVIAGQFDGDNPSSISRREFASICDSEAIQYLGKDADILEEISKSSCVVLPSTYGEGLPKILIEAACLGRPVITSDLAGCRDAVLQGRTGLLIDPKNEIELVEAMTMIGEDSDLAAELGENAREYALNRFDVTHVVQTHMELYQGMLNA